MSSCFLLTCIGTRGDVQPFVALGLGLLEHFPNRKVAFVTHPEFENLIKSQHKDFEFYPITLSTTDALKTPEGIAVKTGKNPLTLFGKVRSFVRLTLEAWFHDMVEAIKKTKPALIFVATMPFFCDIQGVAKSMGIPSIIVHTVPAYPTKYIAPPTAAMGQSSFFKSWNLFVWKQSSKLVYTKVYKDIVNETLQKYGFPKRTCNYDEQIVRDSYPVVFIYSEKLLSRPLDWPQNLQVVGSFHLQTSGKQEIPLKLERFIDSCIQQSMPIFYVGLGSMLSVIFDTPEQITKVLNTLVEGSLNAKEKHAVILHTVTGSSQSGTVTFPLSDSLFVLEEPVSHSSLFPRLSGVVHHGGMGTTHASLIAGKPCLILPCGPTSDQPFWADVVFRKRLGPKGFPIQKISARKFTNAMRQFIQNLDQYTTNVGKLALEMKSENATTSIVQIVNKILV